MSSLKNKTLSGLIWSFAERISAQLVSFIVTTILARIICPEEYGLVAVCYIFIAIMNCFATAGMGLSLVQKKEIDDLDVASVFWSSIVISMLMYAVVFISAPYIASAFSTYDTDTLTTVIRLMTLRVPISAINSVQGAMVSRRMQFRKFFWATLIGTVISAIIGITMALKGFGVYALVAQYLSNVIIDTIIVNISIKFRVKFAFSKERAKKLLSYGWKLLAADLISNAYEQLRSAIIGVMYNSTDLAFYDRAKSFPSLIINNVNTSISKALFPAMASEQSDTIKLKSMTRRAIMTSTYIMSPLMIGLACCGEAVIELLLTDKWLPALPFMRIFCITYLFYPIHTANLNAIKAIGRSDIFFKLEVIKKIVGVALLVTTMWFGVMAMAYSLLLSTVISMIINSWPNKKLLGYSIAEQIKDILPGLLLAGFMGISVLLVELLNLSSILTLIVQILLGAVVYISLSMLFKLEAFSYSWSTIKSFLGRIKKSKAKTN